MLLFPETEKTKREWKDKDKDTGNFSYRYTNGALANLEALKLAPPHPFILKIRIQAINRVGCIRIFAMHAPRFFWGPSDTDHLEQTSDAISVPFKNEDVFENDDEVMNSETLRLIHFLVQAS